MIKTLHEIKIKTLKNIFSGCLDFKYDIIDNYDFTQPDGVDESGSGGVWDLAGIVTDNLLAEIYEIESVDDLLYQRTKDKIQSFLYCLFCEYKDEN